MTCFETIIPSNTPLPTLSQLISSGMLLASGEANYFDFNQKQPTNLGTIQSVLNPDKLTQLISQDYPNVNLEESGLYHTERIDFSTTINQSGLFSFDGINTATSGNIKFDNDFSSVNNISISGSQVLTFGTPVFLEFGSYIHYYPSGNLSSINATNMSKNFPIKIDFTPPIVISGFFNPYPRLNRTY